MIFFQLFAQLFAVVLLVAWIVWLIHDKIDDINKWNQKRLEKRRLAEIEKLDKRKSFIDI